MKRATSAQRQTLELLAEIGGWTYENDLYRRGADQRGLYGTGWHGRLATVVRKGWAERRQAQAGSDFCLQHDPTRREDVVAAIEHARAAATASGPKQEPSS